MRFQHLSLIVADDQRSSRDIAVEILRTAGARDIRQARDGAEAFNLACQRPPDVMILDFEMPRDGLTALRQIRTAQASPNRQMHVIMMTGLTTPDRIAAMRDAGASEIVAKPLSGAKLLRRIESVLMTPRPFIEAATYVGPDRRRARADNYLGPLRRASDPRDDVFEIA